MGKECGAGVVDVAMAVVVFALLDLGVLEVGGAAAKVAGRVLVWAAMAVVAALLPLMEALLV